ncbi:MULTISPECIES: hypothetical protein [Methylorubrum]|uniref:hypothetical protein n=1 Tax=Methylorubrum TaxID=2282523 RepID=UPI00209EFB4B|nr:MULTISPECIES: hypothetical protein [Methylorubrum]MCP1550696.1 hypothetical protein [Methylorubrum zatmanii]MCP1552691.1 hypothetical protein [Methylorubrum extorquens]MCP1580999.1 hypothetical protein [Methylorubrum extorquens]
MPMRWYFHTDGDAIEMVARAEGEGGMIGDAHGRIEPNDPILEPPGLTYAALKAAGGGVLEIADDYKSFTITAAGRDTVKAA